MEFARVLVWLVVYAALGALGLPIAARLFPRFDGRGAGLALPVALVVLTLPVYWLGHLAYGPLTIAVGLLVLAAVAAWAGLDLRALRDGEIVPAVEIDRKAARDAGVVFAAAFLFLVSIRIVDPAVHPAGGEKFLDFGLLKTLARATSLPPEDMWFANEPVRYYYGGHLIASILSHLTLTAPHYAYNLALAGFYATLVTAVFDLGGAIAAERDTPRYVGGLFAAFFVGFASNLVTIGRVLLQLVPMPYRYDVAQWVAAQTPTFTAEELLTSVDHFSYWTASRVISGTINEFPLFAWLNGDLHAHMMGTPFLVLAAALGFSYYLTPESARTRRRILVFVAIPLLAGLQAVVDTWSFPSIFGLAWLALALSPADPATLLPEPLAARLRTGESRNVPDRIRIEITRPLVAVLVVGVAGVAGAVLAAPFLLGAAGGRELAILAPTERSSLGGLLLVHGAFVVAFAAYLLHRIRIDRPLMFTLGIGALLVVVLTQQMVVLALTIPLLVLSWLALRFDRPIGYEAVLIVAGAGLVTLVEFVYVKEQAGPLRMNTVFKTYMQVWVLWGTGTGVAVATLWHAAEARASSVSSLTTHLQVSPETRRIVTTVFVVGLVLSTSVYGAFALSNHFDNPQAAQPTLDATQFVEEQHPKYAPAIDWLDDRTGQPTMLSAPATSRCLDLQKKYPCEPGMYSWQSSPAASLTGVPTVAGWGHEVGYRGPEAYFSRARDVDTIYTGTMAQRAELLRLYDVEYIWIGPAERMRYGRVSFVSMPGVSVVFENSAVTIYQVNRSALPAGE